MEGHSIPAPYSVSRNGHCNSNPLNREAGPMVHALQITAFPIPREGRGPIPARGAHAHVDHGVGRDPEERGALVDLLDLFAALGRQPQGLQLAERALQRRAVLGDQVVAGAQVLHLAGQGPQSVLQLRLVGLGDGLFVS